MSADQHQMAASRALNELRSALAGMESRAADMSGEVDVLQAISEGRPLPSVGRLAARQPVRTRPSPLTVQSAMPVHVGRQRVSITDGDGSGDTEATREELVDAIVKGVNRMWRGPRW
jgi:hypothetical protein